MCATNHTSDNLLIGLTTFRACMLEQGMPCPSVATLHRWIAEGVSGVKMKTKMVGGRRFTTLAWFEEFNAEIQQIREFRRPK